MPCWGRGSGHRPHATPSAHGAPPLAQGFHPLPCQTSARAVPAPPPRLQLYTLRPERAVTDLLMWTRNWKRAQELAWLVAGEYAHQLQGEAAQPREGVVDWLQVGWG